MPELRLGGLPQRGPDPHPPAPPSLLPGLCPCRLRAGTGCGDETRTRPVGLQREVTGG